jgi:UDP-N-acetyl-D-mannosaminuronate dehydrogenase
VIGFDINQARVKELQGGNDATLEVAGTKWSFSPFILI